MRVRVVDVELFVAECRCRLPFRFGSSTLTDATTLTAKVTVEAAADANSARPVEGFAADLLVPKWFEKDPRKSARDDVANLLASVRAAAAAYTAPSPGPGGGAESPFELWWRVYRERVHEEPPEAPDRLVRGFGVALIERAVLDAACRAAGLSLFDALRQDLFGFRPGAVHAGLSGWSLAASLPRAPVASVRVRHTVGLVDPLTDDDIPADERLDDGLPQSLEQSIRAYGLDCFKVKIGVGVDADRGRLLAIAGVLEACQVADPRLSLDGNEQYEDLAEVVRLLRALEREPRGRRLLDGLLYVEQPLPRAHTFDAGRTAAMAELRGFAPVVIDEADGGIGDFERGIALGYRGVSAKSCKGVFRALVNRGLGELRSDGADRLFQTAEDLTTLPVLALQQDLALIAALGFEDVERNGHHYFRGLAHLPAAEAAAAAAAHPDLYRRDGDDRFVAIAGGRLALGSLQCPGFGYDVPIDTRSRTPLDQWGSLRGSPE